VCVEDISQRTHQGLGDGAVCVLFCPCGGIGRRNADLTMGEQWCCEVREFIKNIGAFRVHVRLPFSGEDAVLLHRRSQFKSNLERSFV
jgi:hypothetical protein